jgi:hypothetical protein
MHLRISDWDLHPVWVAVFYPRISYLLGNLWKFHLAIILAS